MGLATRLVLGGSIPSLASWRYKGTSPTFSYPVKCNHYILMDTQLQKREVPKWVETHITMKGGRNEFGDPNFRVIWGGNRYHLVGGMFKSVTTFKDKDGRDRSIVVEVPEIRNLLKYHPHRWHLERWRGPEYYGTREEWYQNSWDEMAQLHTMGDYPDRGDYEHVFYLAMCPHMEPGDKDWCMHCQVGMGVYIDLEPNVYVLDMQIYALLKSEDVSNIAEMGALFMREQIKRSVRNKIVGERVRNAMRPSWAVQPHSTAVGKRSVDDPAISAAPLLPRNKLGFSQSDHTMPLKKQKDLDDGI